MFTKYDNIDPSYIPVNVYWPGVPNCNEPNAILLTRYAAFGDTFPIVFQVNKYLSDRFVGSEMHLVVKNFRGEQITEVSTVLEGEILKINLDKETLEKLTPDVYYLELSLHNEGDVYTVFDRGCDCLTII